MNIKLQTNEQLNATVTNGLAGVFINGVSLSASLSSKADLTALQNYYTRSETSSASEISTALENAGSKVYFDNHISGIAGSNDLSVVKLSAAEYAQMLDSGTCLSNAIYIVEAPNIDALKQQIKNVAPGVELSDAVNVEQLNAISVAIPMKVSQLANDSGFTTNIGTITGITMNGASKGSSGNVNLGTVLTAHQSLANYYKKSETSSATEISSALSTKSAVSFSRITTSGTNIGSITIDGTTTQIYAPTGGGGGGGGSSVQVSADYQTGTRVATISVDSVPTSIYVPNSSGGSSRYALVTAQLASDGGSLTCAVDDQTITTIQVSSSTTPVVVQLPAQPEDGARDFILRIEISSSAAPTFTFNGVNETIDFDSEDDDWAVMEPGLNLVSFTETKRGTGTNSGGSTPTYCTVTFDIENGLNASDANATFANSSDATRQVEAGQPVGTLPTLNYLSSYYSFDGWRTTSSSTSQQVTDQTVITNDITFYASFSYNSSGGVIND